ncbi:MULTISPECIES: hypothetical protein [Aquimarina]|uniref:hypothetical protein n=1 Tax=Aquimarina TaxID=290174 RepID=UPI000944ADA9|nr:MULTISPECIES: hypothetical protein [Aquimarina]
MKKIVIIIIILPFLRYFPLNFNESLNDFFVNNSFYLSIIAIFALTIFAFKIRKRITYISLGVVLFQIVLGNQIQNICNYTVIEINKGKQVKDFNNPFLGMKMKLGENNAVFYYENYFSSYKSLLFEKSHGIKDEDLKNDELNFELTDVIKVYNNDWYLIRVD